MKKTAVAPANIAFIKYWGKKDNTLRIPLNDSFSMNIDGATSTTTVEFSDVFDHDVVSFIGESVSEGEIGRVVTHLDRIRNLAHKKQFARVVTKNSFPKSTGLASSASGFAALTVSGCQAIGLFLSEKELTILARLGSGSACRSIPNGFVLWNKGETSETSFAQSLYPSTYWPLYDVIAVVSKEAKKISTTAGMDGITTSPYWKKRIANIPERILRVKQSFQEKNFQLLGEVIEEDCLDMHQVMQTQTPVLQYWNKGTKNIMDAVIHWRNQGVSVYFTIDAGPNVHLICEEQAKTEVIKRIQKIKGIQSIITNTASIGTHCINTHLF
jgi:diphosphomevalonate decarboxylase